MPRLAVQAKIGTALQLGAPRTISAARAGHREQSRDAVSIAGFGAVHLNRIMPGATDALLAGALQGWLLNARNPPSRLGPVPEVARNPTDQPDRPSGLNSDSPFGSASAGEDEAVHRIPAQRRRASSGTEPSPVRQRLVPRMSRRKPLHVHRAPIRACSTAEERARRTPISPEVPTDLHSPPTSTPIRARDQRQRFS